jgi:hypothetical protein
MMEFITFVVFPIICAVILAYVIHVIIKDWEI